MGNREYWPEGHRVMTLGPHTGHTVRPIAFCDTPETAQALGFAPALLFSLKEAVELFEMDRECLQPGTAAYTWLTVARQIISKAEGRE